MIIKLATSDCPMTQNGFMTQNDFMPRWFHSSRNLEDPISSIIPIPKSHSPTSWFCEHTWYFTRSSRLVSNSKSHRHWLTTWRTASTPSFFMLHTDNEHDAECLQWFQTHVPYTEKTRKLKRMPTPAWPKMDTLFHYPKPTQNPKNFQTHFLYPSEKIMKISDLNKWKKPKNPEKIHDHRN